MIGYRLPVHLGLGLDAFEPICRCAIGKTPAWRETLADRVENQIERTHRNIEVIWLLRHLKPDFKTISDFRRDNRAAFEAMLRRLSAREAP